MSNQGVQSHLEGTARLPPAVPEYPNGHTLLTDEVDELEKIEEKWVIYNQREATIKAQILTTIPETLAIKVQNLDTGKEIWDALCKKHEKRALTVVVDLQHRIYVLKSLDDLNVKSHIQSLNTMYQQLKGMVEEISEQDFMTLILASHFKSYQPLINMISLQNHAAVKPLKPNVVMESILEEFKRLQIEDSQSKSTENAMLVKGGKGKGKGEKSPTNSSGNTMNPDIECWNCGEKGHIRSKCPKEPKKKQFNRKGKVQEAHTSQPQDDYAFSSNLVREA